MIHVAVCTPLPALRAGLRALISGDPDLAVVATAATREDLSAELSPGRSQPGEPPDVIVATPEGAGSPSDEEPDSAIQGAALLLVSDDPRLVRQWAERAASSGMDQPAWGAISPEASAETLQAAIHALAEGLIIFSPEVFERRILAEGPAPLLAGASRIGDETDEGEVVEALTPREHEILGFISQGLTNKQIALSLRISEHTVKFHVSSIYSKLGASNRTEAVRKGARRGWVPL